VHCNFGAKGLSGKRWERATAGEKYLAGSNTKEKKYRMRVVEKRDFQVGCSLKWGISLVGSSSSFDRFVFAPIFFLDWLLCTVQEMYTLAPLTATKL
jgi:hypothetical protein